MCNRKKAFVMSNFLAILYGFTGPVDGLLQGTLLAEKEQQKKRLFICFPLSISLSQTYCTLIQIGLSRRLRVANEIGSSCTVRREEEKKWKRLTQDDTCQSWYTWKKWPK